MLLCKQAQSAVVKQDTGRRQEVAKHVVYAELVASHSTGHAL